MKCPYCSNEIADDSSKCEICGATLKADFVVDANSVPIKAGEGFVIADSVKADMFKGLVLMVFGIAFATMSIWMAFTMSFILLGFIGFGILFTINGLRIFLHSCDALAGTNRFGETCNTLKIGKKATGIITFFIFWFAVIIHYSIVLFKEPEKDYFLLGFMAVGFILGVYCIIVLIKKGFRGLK